MADELNELEVALVENMKKLMLVVAMDPSLSEQDRTEKLRRGRAYIAANGRSEILDKYEPPN